MQNTLIEIEQRDIKTRRIVVKGIAAEHQLQRIAENLESGKIDHPDEVCDVITKAGLEVIDSDLEGCYTGSEFEYLDDWTEEADNGNGN